MDSESMVIDDLVEMLPGIEVGDLDGSVVNYRFSGKSIGVLVTRTTGGSMPEAIADSSTKNSAGATACTRPDGFL